MAPSKPLQNWEKSIIAVALSWGAGVIDIVGYLSLHQAFAAHMTGNTVSSVLYGLDRDGPGLLHRLTPIPTFFLGLLAAEVIIESARRRGRRHIASRALGLEALCLAIFLALGLFRSGASANFRETSAPTFVLLIGLIAVAMGVQSASLRRIGALTIFTTFITGTLTKLADDLASYLFWLRDRVKGRLRQRLGVAMSLSPRRQSFQSVILLSALYLAYAAGALSGVTGFHHWGVAIAIGPLLLVSATVVVDLIRPMSPVP